ncbi:energy-coupling factor transporter transmembrane protein EcfT [Corynebacterium sp. H128]|uniref:energy-coupling factor transporter transmembrane component T family protein n=1 Tax=Corynebacterium sp. H128 TaxID=3133427 RepID=UPI0030A3D6D9
MPTVPLGVYVPGDSLIHRARPGCKFGALMAFILCTSIFIKSLSWALAALLLPLLGYVLAKIPVRVAWQQLWPAAPILLMLFGFQWWQLGFAAAAVIVLVIYAAIAAATLLTLTIKISAMMDAIAAALEPLRRFGVPVDSIVLAVSLTIRLIPLQLATVLAVLDARKARGADFSLRALGTPVLIRSIKRARDIGDALIARGAGD